MSSTEVFEAPWGELKVTADGDSRVFTRHGRKDGDGVEIARYDADAQLLHLFPIDGVDRGCARAYSRIREIQIDTSVWSFAAQDPIVETRFGDLALNGLPEGLGVIFTYGLSLPKHYRRLVSEVEDATKCTIIQLGAQSGISGDVLHLTVARFQVFVSAVKRHLSRGSDVVARLNDTEAFNVVADVAGTPTRKPSPGRLPAVKAMTKVISGETDLDEDGRAELLDLISAESRAALKGHPKAFGRLRADLDLVTLDVLIEQFETSLTGPAARKEATWQTFFRQNVFALQQLFAAPITLVDEQVHVRIPSLRGTGTRAPDFLLVNTVARSVHLVEIKTPVTKMLAGTYRGRDGAEVFPPDRELAGAVAQVQSQIQSAFTDLPLILQRTPDAPALDPSVIRGAVIAGSIADMSDTHRESFMRYRAGLAGVEVITFDEVLDRLKGLQQMLTATSQAESDEGDA